jgi:hypothetical protein
MTQRGRNPYECFKDDNQRRLALLSRDVRYVLIATIAALTGTSSQIHAIVAGLIA